MNSKLKSQMKTSFLSSTSWFLIAYLHFCSALALQIQKYPAKYPSLNLLLFLPFLCRHFRSIFYLFPFWINSTDHHVPMDSISESAGKYAPSVHPHCFIYPGEISRLLTSLTSLPDGGSLPCNASIAKCPLKIKVWTWDMIFIEI